MKIDKKFVVDNINKSKDIYVINVNKSDKYSSVNAVNEVKKVVSKNEDYQITIVRR